MANVRQGNTHYIDTTGVLSADQCKIAGVVVSATAAGAILLLDDGDGSNKKIDLRVATSGDSKFFDFSSSPISFPLGLKAATVTNAICMVIYTQ